MVKKKASRKRVSKKENDQKFFAFLATFLSIVGFVIALVVKRDDKYVMYYAKQSLVIFIIWIIVSAFEIIPFIGSIIYPILYLATLVLWIMSWVFALSNKMKEVPIIGAYAKKIKL